MEDEASILLDGKTLGNLRVVDLKQELEKRGLSKSGSKKDLVKRLKAQLEFEKLCGERKTASDCDLKLDLDADTEQNEFVQQYLAQQQKIYAEQKEAKRRIELEETLKSTEENENCDSTKDDDDATADDDDQTEPDEPEDDNSRSGINSKAGEGDVKTDITIPKAEEDITIQKAEDTETDITRQNAEEYVKSGISNQNAEEFIKTDISNQNAEEFVKIDITIQKTDDTKTDARSPKTENTSSVVQDNADHLENSQTANVTLSPAEELVKDIVITKNGDHENQIVSSNVQVPVDSSVESTKSQEIINIVDQITSSEIIQTECHDSSSENAERHQVEQSPSSENCTENIVRQETVVPQTEQSLSSEFIQDEHEESCTENIEKHETVHQTEQSLPSEFIQDKHAESCIEKTQEITHQVASSEIKETLVDSRESTSPKPEMEPATQFSTVPYSLMDIQLPESPGNVKPKTTPDSVEKESVNSSEETQSNGIDSANIKSSERESNEKTDSKDNFSEKVGSADKNLKHASSNFDEHTQLPKESNAGDSKISESRSELKQKESGYKSSRSRECVSDRKTRKPKDELLIRRDSRSKSRERKKTRRSSEDSPRHSRSKSMDKARKLKEDSRNRRDSRSRSKEKDRRTQRYKKDLDTSKMSRSHSDSRSRSKESDQKMNKSNIDSKTRKVIQSHRKSRSLSNDSKSAPSSDSDKEYPKRKDNSKQVKQKRKDRGKKSDSESRKSSSSGSDTSPSRSSGRKGYSRQKNKHHKRDSSGDTLSSRSRSPVKKKHVRRSEDRAETSIISKHGRSKCRDDAQNSRSRSRESNPVEIKSLSKQVEKCDKEKEISHRDESLDSGKIPQSLDHDENSIKKKSKNQPSEFKVLPKSGSENVREQKHRNSDDEASALKNKSLEQFADSSDLVKSSKLKSDKRNENSESSRNKEKGPSQNKVKCKSESHTDIEKTSITQEERSSKSRSKSREHSPVKYISEEQSSDSAVPCKSRNQDKEIESRNSDDQTSRSRSRESTPNEITKGSIDESNIDPAASTKFTGEESQGSVDQNSMSKSKEKSPVFKKSEISSDEPCVDSSGISEHQTKPTKIIISSDIPGAVKKGNITIVKREPLKQKLKIKRDNVVISSQNKKEEMENQSEKPETTESTKENQKELTSASVRAPYVSRKITLSNRSQSVASDDEPKSKKSKWGNLASTQKMSPTINISTDSLKNWFPDFKLLKDPTPEEPASLTKEESEIEISVNKTEDSRQGSSAKKFQEPQREMQMEVDLGETGPVSKILFIQNLVRPFTLNQLKELLRETGNFIEEDFWIDKIKSKCFVTYETEEEAIKTRSHLNGTRWPSSNPKILSVEFSNEEELTHHRSGNDIPKTVLQPVPEPNDAHENRASHSVDEFRKKEHDPDRKRDRSKPPVREWDKDKITQESPDRERSGKEADKSKYLDKKEKKDSKRRANEDTPAKLLDDLFQKTKSSPCIYWLPLTDEQVQERMEARRVRRLEREKRNQQREQEEAENKNKRPRSRNRTREAESRRSSTRSRSPVVRRR